MNPRTCAGPAMIAGVLLLGACAQPTRPLPTVPQVDLERYTGTWYEIALLPNRFQSRCVADTQAQYTRDDEHIRVLNRCREEDGDFAEAGGIAKVVPGSGNAKLRVSFFRPFYGDYWILALDPEYRWVLVGEEDREYGWVLSRTPRLEEATLNAVLDRAQELGYERARFVLTPQSAR